MKKNSSFCLGVFLSLSLVQLSAALMPTAAQAASGIEIRLHDCEGNLRASTEVQAGGTKDVQLSLPAEESNVQAKLSKFDSESAYEHRAKDKSLTFSSVQSGDWKVCRNDGSPLAFTSVEFVEGSSESLRIASLVAGGAAVISGVAIASGDSDSGSGDTFGATEPNQPDRATTEKPASALEAGKSTRPEGEVIVESRCNKKPKTAAATNNACREGEEAPVISPYN